MFRYTFKCYSKATSLNDLDTLSQRLSSWTASANRRRYVHRWRKLFEQGDRRTLETFLKGSFHNSCCRSATAGVVLLASLATSGTDIGGHSL